MKFMEIHFPGSTVLEKWKKALYTFRGNIGVDKCAHLVKTIRAEVEKDKKRKGKVDPELAAAEKWLQQAERRQREVGTRVKRGERGTYAEELWSDRMRRRVQF